MDQMDAFDRQLASVVLRRVGPSAPVDDAAILSAITATQSPKWRFQSMFSATKFVVAGAIVALFGGFLLTGVLPTQPSEEQLPAVGASASATAQATDEPGAGIELNHDLVPGVELVTREVEPGVFQVLHDGLRPLDYSLYPSPAFSMVARTDGSTWVFGPREFYRVGDASAGMSPEGFLAYDVDIATDPDGTLWLGTPSGLFWARASRWVKDPDFGDRNVRAIEVGPDGTQWILWCPDAVAWDLCQREQRITRRTDDRTERIRPPQDYRFGGDSVRPRNFFAVDASGGLWMSGASDGLLHFDGSDWEIVGPLGEGSYGWVGQIDVAADGTLWAYFLGPEDSGEAYLARLIGEEWTIFSQDDGVPVGMRDIHMGLPGILTAAEDGSVWLVPGIDGSAWHFDGSTWRTFLDGLGVGSLGLASDGSAWVHGLTLNPARGGNPAGAGDVHTYVITPEAVASRD